MDEDMQKRYFDKLGECFLFKSPLTKDEFNREVRKFLTTDEQIHCHNYYLLALMTSEGSSNSSSITSTTNTNSRKNTSNGGSKLMNALEAGLFECADIYDYIEPSSPTTTMLPPSECESRSAASELFMPDSGFVTMRIALTALRNGLNGADANVTDLMVHACQAFVKNILMAMAARIKSYKVRNARFVYGFNYPVPDPLIRNCDNVVDETRDSKVEVAGDGRADSFAPKCRTSLENAEQRVAFAYSCAKRRRSDNMLTVRLLYDTLRDNPHLLGSHEMQSVNLLKLSVQLEG